MYNVFIEPKKEHQPSEVVFCGAHNKTIAEIKERFLSKVSKGKRLNIVRA